MIKRLIICDKCKKEKESHYKDAEGLIVFISRKNYDDEERMDFEKDLCEECYEKFKWHIRAFFEE